MKKQAQRVSSFVLVLMIVFSCFGVALTADAAQLSYEVSQTSLPDNLYLAQEGTSTCTLCSAAMMLRSRMYLSGNSSWSSVTESGIKSVAWSNGLKWSWSYTINGNTMSVAHSTTSGISVSSLKGLIDSHPEGIVLYCGNLPHAVFLLDYDGDTFYCADTIASYSGYKRTLASSYLGKKYGSQSSVLSNVTAYWYVSSYSITNNINPPTDLSISINKNAFAVGEEVKFTFYSNNSTEQYIPIDVNGVRKHFIDVTGRSEYTTSFTEPGTYYFCLYAKNSAKDASTEFYPFTVYDNIPSDLSISIDKNLYMVGENVTFRINAKNATEQYIPIDVNGVRKHFIDVTGKSEYTTCFNEAGTYYYCLYTKNFYGDPSTEYYPFTVYDRKPTNLSISMDKEVYKVGKNVTFRFNSTNAVEQYLPIDINGVRRDFIDISNKTEFTTSFSEPGVYGYFLYTKNLAGDEGTEYKEFVVIKPITFSDDFGALIINTAYWKPLYYQGNNQPVYIQHEDVEEYDHTLWHFVKNSDDSYSIRSYLDGSYLTPESFSGENGARIITAQSSDTSWYVVELGDGGRYLMPKNYSKVVDLSDNDGTDGNGFQMYKINFTDAQKYNIYFVEEERDALDYQISADKSSIKTNESSKITISGNVPYVYNYKLHIVDPSGKENVIDNKCSMTYTFKPSTFGTFRIFAEVTSPIGKQIGSTSQRCVTVNVSCSHNYVTQIIEPTYTEKGYTLHTCLICGDTFKDNYTDVKKHEYELSGWTWNGTTSATANFTCKDDSSQNKTVNATITNKTIAVTCEKAGKTVYTATATFNGKTYTDTKEAPISAKGHNYKLTSWSWNGYSSATATFTCENDSKHTQTVNATITSKTTNATCETAGTTVYIATATFEGKPYTDTKEVPISAKGHNYKLTSWNWNGNSSATATFTCENDSKHMQTVNATITNETTAATCEKAGKTVYTVTATFEGKPYTDTKEVPISAIGHKYVLTSWNWDGDNAVAIFTCENDNAHTTTVTANVTSKTEGDTVIRTAAVVLDGQPYTNTKTDIITPAQTDSDTSSDKHSDTGNKTSDTDTEKSTDSEKTSDTDISTDNTVDTESNTETHSDVVIESDSDNNNDTETSTDTSSDDGSTDSEPTVANDSDTENADTSTDTNPTDSTDTQNTSDSETGTATSSESDTVTDIDTSTDTSTDTNTNSDAETSDSDSNIPNDSEADTASDVDTSSDINSDTDTNSDIDTSSDNGSDTESKTDTDIQSDSDTDTSKEVDTETDSDNKLDDQTDTDKHSDTDEQTDTDTPGIPDDKPKGTYGDLDGDGDITANDALMILRASVGMETLTPNQIALADVDGDGDITANDALAVLRYSVGMGDGGNVGKEIA